MTYEVQNSVADWLTRRVDTCPDGVAIWHPREVLTYRELGERAAQMAGFIRSMGVPAGATVALLIQHGIGFAVAVHACIQGEYRIVPLNARLTAEELAFQLEDADVALVLYDPPLTALADGALVGCARTVLRWNVTDALAAARPLRRQRVILDHPFCFIYTSGTSGRPKGVILTFGNFLWSAFGSAVQLGLSTRENWLVPLPLFHVGGLSVLVRSVIYGTTASVLDQFDAKTVNGLLDAGGITLLSVVPTLLRRLLAERGDIPYPATLRTILLGGSGASLDLLEQCQRLGIPVAQSYGLTEAASQVCTLSVHDGLRKLGSSGKPLLPTELTIVNPDGSPVPVGEIGDIAIRGQTVSPGYLHDHSTADHRADGWMQTGDIGRLDEDGYLYVLDRRADLIVSGGENVYPAEIERVLQGHPAVLESGVVGAPSEQWGQVPVAFVELQDDLGTTAVDLIAWCRTRLARYKVPTRIVFVAELPRNAGGKMLRRMLREWL